jgi:hypothetical protein
MNYHLYRTENKTTGVILTKGILYVDEFPEEVGKLEVWSRKREENGKKMMEFKSIEG